MLCSVPWLFMAFPLWLLFGRLEATRTPAVGWWIAVLTLQAAGASIAVARSVGWSARPRALVTAMAAVTLLELALLPQVYGTGRLGGISALAVASVTVAIPLSCALAPLFRPVGYIGAAVAGTVASGVLVMYFDPAATPQVLVLTALAWAVIGVWTRFSLWFLATLRQFNAAREAQAQLAVAEERLRFARDLHDVIGRSLSVIALKAELAERLTENKAAGRELEDVQGLARKLHHEVRSVVRGHRSVDLDTELQGARCVLEAAGVTCHIHKDNVHVATLTEQAQTALGWVVREGVTNVLRHSRADHCTIQLCRTEDGASQLTIINNGVDQPSPPGSGTGLRGLTERLLPLGGSLCHGAVARATYRLSARLPKEPSR